MDRGARLTAGGAARKHLGKGTLEPASWDEAWIWSSSVREIVISRGSRAKPADLPHGVLAGALPKMWEMSLSALMNASIACEGSEAMESGNVDSSSFG